MSSVVPSPQFGGDAHDRQSPVVPDVGREIPVMSGAAAFSELALEHPLSRRFFQSEAEELRLALAPLSDIHPGFSQYIDFFTFRASNPEASAAMLQQKDLPEGSQHLAEAQRAVRELPIPKRELDPDNLADQAALVARTRAEKLGDVVEAMKIASPHLIMISERMLAALESIEPERLTEIALAQATTPAARDQFYARALPKEWSDLIGLDLRLVGRLILECARWQELLRETLRRVPDALEPDEMLTVNFSEPLGTNSISAATVQRSLLENSPNLEQWGTFSSQLEGHLNARIARIYP